MGLLMPPLPALSTVASELLVLVVALLVALGRVAVVLPIVGRDAKVAVRAFLLAFAFSFSFGEALALFPLASLTFPSLFRTGAFIFPYSSPCSMIRNPMNQADSLSET